MFELFKNAMRATIEHHGVDEDLPDIRVYVVRGSEDLSIKVFCMSNCYKYDVFFKDL